jgi:hypothetical protein
MNEINDALTGVSEVINQYDWGEGMEGMSDVPNPGMFDISGDDNNPWNGGEISLTNPASYSTQCELGLEPYVGIRLAVPMCFIFNILRELALLPWFQLFINLAVIAGLATYFYRKWLDPGFA